MLKSLSVSSIHLGLLGAALACALVVGCSTQATTGSGTGGSGGSGGSGGNGGGNPCSGQACAAVELAHVQYWMSRPVLDGDQIYWSGALERLYVTSTGGPSQQEGVIVSLPKAGGNPLELLHTSYLPGWPAVDGTHLYWGQTQETASNGADSFVGRIPKAGGAEAPWSADASNHPMNVAVDATNIYFTTAERAVMSLPKAGGPAVMLAADQDPVGPLAVDDTSVYWTSGSTVKPNIGAVKKVAKAGGAPVTLASGFQGAYGVVLDDTSVYYSTGVALMKVAKAGGAPVTLVPEGPPIATPIWIAVDDTHVYFTTVDGTLNVMPKSGGTPTELVKLEPGETLGAVAVDATSVYWARVRMAPSYFNYESFLMKMPK